MSGQDRGDSRTFTINRTFDAPRALVFKLWTSPEHLARWWGPKGFAIRVVKLDARPGGIFHYVMTSATGAEMWGKKSYREIVPPERIVFVNSFSDPAGGLTRHPLAPTWPLEMLTTVVFVERDGKTEIKLSSVAHQASAFERATFEAGFESMRGGFGGTFDQLADYLRTKPV